MSQEEQKDLKIEIDTPAGKVWSDTLADQKQSLLNSQINVQIATMMVELCESKVAEEKEKLK